MTTSLTDTEMDLDPYLLFLNAIRSTLTKEKYQSRLTSFFNFIVLPQVSLNERCKIFINKSKDNPYYTLNCVFKFVIFLKGRMERKEIVVSTIYNYLKPIKLLCEMNDVSINWRKITVGLPKERKYAEDRSPTLEEIQKLVEYPDRRLYAIISTMVSSGIRLAAWDDLKWKHIFPIKNKDGYIDAAKITVYAGSDEQYYSFITPEAYVALKEWMDFRQQSGENITDESWLMRNLWDATTPSGGHKGLVTVPKKLEHLGIKSLVERALRAQGLRTKLEEGKKRYPFQTDHGFRKFFKTRCELAGMKSINIEILMNHSTGVTDSYYRPLEGEILEDFLKAIENLSIKKQNNKILEDEIKKLKEKQTINEQLYESLEKGKDDAIITLSEKVMMLMEDVRNLKKQQI